MTEYEIAVKMRQKLMQHIINKKDKYDCFLIGLCSVYASVTGKFYPFRELSAIHPNINLQTPEPEFPYGAWNWKTNKEGFIIRMRAIRKFKNKSK